MLKDTDAMRTRFLPGLTGICVIVALACALYLPFLGNPMVFDDRAFFGSAGFAYHANTPFGLGLRLFPYFTLAFPQVLWGYFPPWDHAHIHRVIGLVFHIGTAVALFKLLHDLLLGAARRDSESSSEASTNTAILAAVGAALFVIHPVAVYGAGYLVQRTVVLATFFSVLSVIWFARGLRRNRYIDAATAAFFYVLAVFSKEHSVLLPAVAVMAAPLLMRDKLFAIRYAGIYLLICLPAAITVGLLSRSVVGAAYEPDVNMIISELEAASALEASGSPWLVSAVTQTGLFFKYLACWLVPDTTAMSIDIRIEIERTWSPGRIIFKLAAFAGFGVAAMFLLLMRGSPGLVGFGMLFIWILFAVEFSAVRFQEPFALYRSYLWAPGVVIAITGLARYFSRRVVILFFVAVCPVLLYQAHDRLRIFSSTLTVWEDAASKLPANPVWGEPRVLYNLSRAQAMSGQLDEAAKTADRCMLRFVRSFYCNYTSGVTRIWRGQFQLALPYIERALAIVPKSGMAHYQRALILEKLGRENEARYEYREASRLGFWVDEYRLRDKN